MRDDGSRAQRALLLCRNCDQSGAQHKPRTVNSGTHLRRFPSARDDAQMADLSRNKGARLEGLELPTPCLEASWTTVLIDGR